jgi:hypothetical protein
MRIRADPDSQHWNWIRNIFRIRLRPFRKKKDVQFGIKFFVVDYRYVLLKVLFAARLTGRFLLGLILMSDPEVLKIRIRKQIRLSLFGTVKGDVSLPALSELPMAATLSRATSLLSSSRSIWTHKWEMSTPAGEKERDLNTNRRERERCQRQ